MLDEDLLVVLILILANQLKTQDSLKTPKIISTGDYIYEAARLIRDKKSRVLLVLVGT
jgi:hypothetical protein